MNKIRFREWLLSEGAVELILYHGTHLDFDEFDLKWSGRNQDYGYYGHGIYLTPNPRLAKYYGSKVYRCRVRLLNPLVWRDGKDALYERYGIEGSVSGDRLVAQALTDGIKSDGYDGVIVIGTGGGVGEVCVFDPGQVEVVSREIDLGAEYSAFMGHRGRLGPEGFEAGES